MTGDLAIVIDITEKEFHGGSFNGPSLMTMLKELALDEVTSTDTFEGYAVWGIVLHLMTWKHQLATWLDAPGVPEYAHPGENWPAIPENPTQEAWETTLATIEGIHNAYVTALRSFPEGKLGEVIEAWGCSWADAIAWMTTHDTYHIAQIRNMGLKTFPEPGPTD